MKKLKILMPVLGVSAMAATLVPLANCSCNNPTAQTVLKLSETSKTIYKYGTFKLKATLVTQSNEKVTWSVDDSEVISINDASTAESDLGVDVDIKGLKAGDATITAKYGNYTATCKVTVTQQTTFEYDWMTTGEWVNYENPVPCSTKDFIDTTDFNNIYLQEVSQNPEIFGTDILEGFNHLEFEGGRSVQKVSVKDIKVIADTNNDYSINFKLEMSSTGTKTCQWSGEEEDTTIVQTLDLQFTNMKFKFEKLISDEDLWGFSLDLDSNTADWSIKGDMTKKFTKGEGEPIEESKNFDVAKGETAEITEFKTFAFEDHTTVTGASDVLLLNNLASGYLKPVSSMTFETAEPEVTEGYTIVVGDIGNKSTKTHVKITPETLGTMYFPVFDIYWEYEDFEETQHCSIGTYKFDAVENGGEIEFDLDLDENMIAEYLNFYPDPQERPAIKINLTVHNATSIVQIDYDNIESGITKDESDPKYNPKYGYIDGASGFVGQTKFTETSTERLPKKQNVHLNVNNEESGGSTYTITREPDESALTFGSISWDEATVTDEIKFHFSFDDVTIAKVDFSSVESNLPDGWSLSLEEWGGKIKKYIEVNEDEDQWEMSFYVLTPLSSEMGKTKHNLKFTLSNDAGEKWIRYASQGDDEHSTAIHYTWDNDQFDPTKNYTISMEIQEPHRAYVDIEREGIELPEGWDWYRGGTVYKNDDGKFVFEIEARCFGGMAAGTYKAFLKGEDGQGTTTHWGDYEFVIQQPGEEEPPYAKVITFNFDWDPVMDCQNLAPCITTVTESSN